MNKDILHELFEYRDGVLFRKLKTSNNAKINEPLNTVGKNGYVTITVQNKRQLAHRIIFLMFNGYLPEFIDHIDGNRANNKIENLREATMLQNSYNSKIRKNNTSGVKNVRIRYGKYFAYFNERGKQKTIGHFLTIQEAENAVKLYRAENHGEFARH
jgi:hypothetical protein